MLTWTRCPTFFALLVLGFPACCVQPALAQNQLTAKKLDYTMTASGLDASGNVTTTHSKRTEYILPNGLQRLEDSDANGVLFSVTIRNPIDNTVLTLDAKRKTATLTHEQVASRSVLGFITLPRPGTVLETKAIAGLDCNGFSQTVDGTYHEMWTCPGPDFGLIIERASNGTGWSEELVSYMPSVQVSAEFSNAPKDYTVVQK
jgi:hypothetical protein